ncbi:sugar phosphate isomerase/epimerase [Chryseolinea sp. T2]|uniref:sugar phosphate isomerase/epimerase family protein n=1 Tax=Chryseolinea sp. T2 TaxID=3129255 RepID=UPI003076BBAF
MNRRNFIQIGSAAGSAVMLEAIQAKGTPINETKSSGFELLIFATNWGYQGNWESFCTKIKRDGYDGAEIWLPDEKSRVECFAAFKKHNLRFGLLIGSGESAFDKNLAQFKQSLTAAVLASPVYINCHSGKDFFSFDENKSFIELTIKTSKESNVPVYHETHRGRILYSAPVAKRFIESYPDIRLTLDISHWCNVHESLLADQDPTVSLALEKTGHIHARVGHQEGPQVNDPRAPEWKAAVDAHFAWWDKVVQRKKSNGETMTFLTEFGPLDYMPSLPYTRQPLANQDEINVFMLKTLRSRYA